MIMEYQKLINLLDNAPNQPSKFRTKNWVGINDDASGTYSTNSQIKFKTSMLKSSLCGSSDAYILVKRTIRVPNTAGAGLPANNNGIKVAFKNCAPFTDFISEINNTQIDNAKDIDVVMPMQNLIEYSNSYSKTSGRLWQCQTDEPFRNDDGVINNFPVNSAFVKFKQKITGEREADGTKDVEIMVPLKYWSNFWKTLEMLLINCKINVILTCSADCVVSTYVPDAKLYITSSIQDNAKTLQQLKSCFKRNIYWNKYQWKVTIQGQNRYLDYEVYPSFHGVNRIFVLSLSDGTGRTGNRRYFVDW